MEPTTGSLHRGHAGVGAGVTCLIDTAAAGADPALISPLEQWHQQFVQETRDPNWSPMAQVQVESSLSTSKAAVHSEEAGAE